MKPQTIAVAFVDDASAGPLARAAAALARHHDAHLVGLWVVPAPNFYPAVASYITPEMIAQLESHQNVRQDAARTAFDKAVEGEDLRGEWLCLDAGTRTVTDALLEGGRGADLLVLPRPDPDLYDPSHVHEGVIRNAGRPVLVLPPEAKVDNLHKSAIIGWSQTREATRAAWDALVLLEPGAEVTLLHVGMTEGHALQDGPMNALAGALDRHGLSVTVTHREMKGDSIYTVIEREAFETGAGFVATGAFGHSKFYDFVIGAVTRELLVGATRPVLFSK